MRITFDGQMKQLHEELMEMTGLCRDAIAASAEALEQGRALNQREVEEREQKINGLERDLSLIHIFRREEGVFLVEGPRMFAEVPRERLVKVYASESYARDPEHRRGLEEFPWEEVEDKVFRQMSDTQTPQGVLCIVRQSGSTMEEMLKKEKPLFLILEDIQDPGNLGTIFRTAEGAGADGIFMSRGCVDIYNPKTIRSTMGSIYRVPFCICPDLPALMERMKQAKILTCAAHLQGKNTYDREDYTCLLYTSGRRKYPGRDR